MSGMPSGEDDEAQTVVEDTSRATASARTAFRFKRSVDTECEKTHNNLDNSKERRRSHRHHRHHNRRKRRKLSNEALPSASKLPPDVAFRESLFDAMGDDEGAEYWQSVYGQPIHTYPRTYQDVKTGELEMMDDEQYTQYVRRKMWERSTEGVEAARDEKRREQREKRRRQQENTQKVESESEVQNATEFLFNYEIEASLKRGQHRRDKKKWQQAWQAYLYKWKELQDIYESRGTSADDGEQILLRSKIAWPVESGKQEDLSSGEIEKFIDKVSASIEAEEHDQVTNKVTIVKSERVRWHPDKIQQRYGFMELDRSTIEGVTAVFQVLDRMWNEIRHQQR